MATYVGLDVSTRETAICVVDEAGEKLWEGRRPTDPDAVAEAVRRHAPEVARVGMETGLMAPWLWHELHGRGVPVVCLHARHAKAALSLQMNKTDRNDALGLARLVRSGWYRAVSVKALDTHRLRAVLFARQQLVGMATGLVNKIRGLLRTFGVAVGPGKGASFEAQVRRVLPADDAVLAGLVEGLLRAWRSVTEERRELDRRLVRAARQDPACRLLATAPGVGAVTAVAFATAIEDPARFGRSKDVGAFLGLAPRRYQSGAVDMTGRISKCGDRLVRKLLFEAAHVVLTRTTAPLELKAWGERVAARSGPWKARVALARKLAVVLHSTPAHVRSDNGPEFVAEAVRGWIAGVGAEAAFIEPGSPWENGYVESFNGEMRDELLAAEAFNSLREAQVLIERWRQHYNTARPHSALGYRPPAPEVVMPVLPVPPSRPGPPGAAQPPSAMLH